MSTRLTEQLITYGLSTSTVNALSDGGYWNLDTLLDAVKTWRTDGWHGIALYEFLNCAGIGPALNAELMTALDNHTKGMPSPWAPNPRVGELVNEIVADIHGGTIRHGDALTPASHLVLQRGIKAAAASTTHRLLAARGFLAMRNRRLVSLSLAALLTLSAAAPLAAAPSNDGGGVGVIQRIVKIVRAIKRLVVPSDELNIPRP